MGLKSKKEKKNKNKNAGMHGEAMGELILKLELLYHLRKRSWSLLLASWLVEECIFNGS